MTYCVSGDVKPYTFTYLLTFYYGSLCQAMVELNFELNTNLRLAYFTLKLCYSFINITLYFDLSFSLYKYLK